jgi:hypothetical protein
VSFITNFKIHKFTIEHAAKIPGIVSQIPREVVEEEAVWWAPELVWTLLGKKNFLPLPRNEVFLNFPTSSTVTIVTELFRL